MDAEAGTRHSETLRTDIRPKNPTPLGLRCQPNLNAHYTFDEGNAKDNTKNGNDGKDGFGKPNYVDVTKDLNLEPLSVDPEDKERQRGHG